jgi:hypothetical protein
MRSGKLFLITVAGLVLRHSHISAPGFIQFGGRFGWRRFQYLRLRRGLRGSAACFLGAIVWLIGEMPRLYLTSFEKRHRARSILPACIRPAGN